MSWTDQYIEIPFKWDGRTREGLDCGGLVILVYRELLDIELPDYLDIPTNVSGLRLLRAARKIRSEISTWSKVEKPKPFDLVTFRTGKLDACHVGIVVDRLRMLHIREGINTCIERFNSLQWRPALTGFYRHG